MFRPLGEHVPRSCRVGAARSRRLHLFPKCAEAPNNLFRTCNLCRLGGHCLRKRLDAIFNCGSVLQEERQMQVDFVDFFLHHDGAADRSLNVKQNRKENQESATMFCWTVALEPTWLRTIHNDAPLSFVGWQSSYVGHLTQNLPLGTFPNPSTYPDFGFLRILTNSTQTHILRPAWTRNFSCANRTSF